MTAESTQSTNAEFAAFHKRLAGLEDLLSGHIQQCKDQTKFMDSHKEESSRHTKDRDEKTKELKETLATVSRLVEEAREERGNQDVLRVYSLFSTHNTRVDVYQVRGTSKLFCKKCMLCMRCK